MPNYSFLDTRLATDVGTPARFGFLKDNLAFENKDFKQGIALQAAITNAAQNYSIYDPEFMNFIENELPTYSSMNSQDIINKALAFNTQAERDGISQLLTSQIDQGDVSAATVTAQAVPQAMLDITKEEKLPGKFEKNLIDTTSENMDEEANKNLEFILFAANRLNKIVEDESTWQKIKDMGGAILTPHSGISWQEIADANPFNLSDKVVEYIKNFRSLPVEEKMRMWPAIEKEFINQSGFLGKNRLEAVQMLYSLVDPMGDLNATEEAVGANIALGANTLALIGKPFLGTLSRLSAIGRIKFLSTLSPQLAAKITVKAASDPAFAEAVGQSQVEAISRAGIIDNKKIDPDYSNMVGFHSDKELRDMQKKLDIRLQNIPTIEHGLLFKEEVPAAIDRNLEKGLLDEYIDNPRLLNVEQGNHTTSGFDLYYKLGTQDSGYFKTASGARKWAKRQGIEDAAVKKAEEGYYVELKQRFNFDLGDVEKHPGTESGFIQRHLLSPSSHLFGIDTRITPSATRVEFADATLYAAFRTTARNLLKDTVGVGNRQSRINVAAPLVDGDKIGVTFSKTYLKNNYNLNDKEIKLYYGMRRIFDNFWFLRNDEIRNEMQVMGFRFIPDSPAGPFVRPYANPANAYTAIPDNGVVYDLTRNSEIQLSNSDAVKKVYDSGRIIARLQSRAKLGNDYYNYVIVPKDAPQDLPFAVTNFREGYVAKFNKNAYYFVKQYDTVRLDGKQGRVHLRTLRIAGSKMEANEIAEQEKLLRIHLKKYMDEGDAESLAWLENNGYDPVELTKAIKDNKFSLSTDIETTFDREMSDIELAYEGVGPSRGMYLGHRAPDLRYGKDSTIPERLNPFEALNRNMDNLARLMSRNEWRLGMEQRALNNWRDYFVNKKVTRLKDAVIAPKYKGTKVDQGFQAQRDYILDQLKIPTGRELIFQHTLRSMAEWAEGKKVPDWSRHSLLKLSHRDPYSLMRSMAFHPLLGLFNFSQLYVQAQGASIAWSLHPIYGTRASKDYLIMRSFLNENISDDMIRNILKNVPGVDAEDMVEFRKFFVDSGFRESAFHTADFDTALEGQGVSAGVLKRVGEKGLIFYREGELINKGVSLRVAMLKWKAEHPGQVMDDAAKQEIFDTAIKYTLNMTRANRAWWQKGMTSVPMQFFQIHAKYLEAYLGSVFRNQGFTPAEANRLAIMQILLYGESGIPFGKQITNLAFAQIGVDPTNMEPDVFKKLGIDPIVFYKYVRGGFPDAMAMALFGANIEMGRRSSVAQGVTDLLISMMTNDFKYADLAGAFGGTASRFWNGMRAFKNFIVRPMFDPDMYFTLSNIEIVTNDIAKTASSWRNGEKAWLWYHTGRLESRYGRAIVDQKPNFATAIGVALGFQPTQQTVTYEAKQLEQYRKGALINIAKHLAEMQADYLNHMPSDPEEQQKMIDNFDQQQELWLGGLSADDRTFVKDYLHSVITDDTSDYRKAVDDYTKSLDSNLHEDFNALNPGSYGIAEEFKYEFEREQEAKKGK